MKNKLLIILSIIHLSLIASCGSPSQPKIVTDDVRIIELGDLAKGKQLMFKRNDSVVYASMERETILPDDPNSRFFFVEKKCVFVEEDIDGDGFYEQTVAFLPSVESVGWNGVDPFEIFIRRKDGSVVVGDSGVRKQFYERYKRSMERLKDEVNKLRN